MKFYKSKTYTRNINLPDSLKRSSNLSKVAVKFFPDIIRLHEDSRSKSLKKERNRIERKRIKDHFPEIYEKRLKNSRYHSANLRKKSNTYAEIMEHFGVDIETGTISRQTYTNPNGYLFSIFSGKTFWISRLVMMKFMGDYLEEGLQVQHMDRDIENNKISNLKLTTHKNIMENLSNTGFEKEETVLKKKLFAEEVVKLYEEGMNPKKIGKMLNRSQPGIYTILKGIFKYSDANKIKKTRLTSAEKSEVIKLYEEGMTHKEISDNYCVSRSAISHITNSR